MPEQLPPLTSDDLKVALGNPAFSVYAYIGKESDRGWEVAQAAFNLLPALRIYLVTRRELVSDWTTDATGRAIVWGFGRNPKQHLLKAEADDLVKVLAAINAARSAR
jgi:hypothetical protein